MPKKGKEIQETIEKYLRAGGSLNSKSLPKKLISKRMSLKTPNSNHFVENNDRDSEYATGNNYSYLDNSMFSDKRDALGVHKLSIINPELKNLNLKAVENIMKRLVDQKNARANQQFLRSRKTRYRSRLNTAG